MNYSIDRLEWDSNYFSKPSAKVVLNEQINEQELIEIKEAIRNFEFVVINNTNNNPLNNFLISKLSDYHLVDINVQFKAMMQPINTNNEVFPTYNKFPYDEDIINLVKDSFVHSRFYNDPRIRKNQAENIYTNWIKNSFNQPDKYFIVANEKKGVLLFSVNNKIAHIELIAVGGNNRNQRIGSSLIINLFNFLEDKFPEVKFIKVGTQLDNIKAMNFYSRLNFKIDSISSIYHFWKD